MKIILVFQCCIVLSFLDDIDVAGRLMIAMSETMTKPLKAANVYFEKGNDTLFTDILYGRYENGRMLTMRQYRYGVANGQWINFDPQGGMEIKGTFIDIKVEGPVALYYETDQVKVKGQYVHKKKPNWKMDYL